MHSPEIEQLAFVDANEALRRHFDALNYRRARGFWAVLLIISLVTSLATLSERDWLVGSDSLASFLALAALVPLRRHAAFRRSFATLLFSLLALESVLWLLAASEDEMAVSFSMLLVVPALLVLRLGRASS